MTRIAPVKTVFSNKSLWFDAGDLEIKLGENVVVKTARGIEFGTLSEEVFKAKKSQLKALKSELKPVLRIATNKDISRAKDMEEKGQNALGKFKELAAATNKNMNPISVEYLLDGKKAVFYFNAPERQDFRDLVKKLSSEFKIRVDMHQINERDKAALIGGIGICGQELCCKRLGTCPKRISIKMAKSQGMSLNPDSISGLCGKLLCCLNYEFKDYDEFTKRAPKLKAKIETPEGTAIVCDLSMPKETVQVKYGDPEKRLRVSLADMEIVKNSSGDTPKRPNKIGKEAWEKALNESNVGSYDALFTSVDVESKDELSDGTVNIVSGRQRRDAKVISSGDSKENVKKSNKTNKQKRNKKRNKKKNKNKGGHNRSQAQNQTYNAQTMQTRKRRTRKFGGDGSNSAKKPGQNW